jgi:predicted O-methyltransferase YrrM
MTHSHGHDVLSDFADKGSDDPVFGVYKECGFWTHDEAAILYNVAKIIGGWWLDIGGLTGWTAVHLAAAGCDVVSIDPMYNNPEFLARAEENIFATPYRDKIVLWSGTLEEILTKFRGVLFGGAIIDGNHEAPYPLKDAANVADVIPKNGVVLFHDATFKSVKTGYRHLFRLGWHVRIYHTPHRVAVCYRDDFVPPYHEPDPRIP